MSIESDLIDLQEEVPFYVFCIIKEYPEILSNDDEDVTVKPKTKKP